MREEVKRVVAEEDRKREEKMKAAGLLDEPPAAEPAEQLAEAVSPLASRPKSEVPAAPVPFAVPQTSAATSRDLWWLLGVLAVLLIGTLLALWRKLWQKQK
jgi:hypothetical protein